VHDIFLKNFFLSVFVSSFSTVTYSTILTCELI